MSQKTILITGATGFLGSHLVKKFLEEGHTIIILKRSFSNTWRIDNLLTHVKTYNVDEHDLKQIFTENKNIDTVIHTATCYGRNNESVSDIINSNVYFPLKLLEIATFFNTDTFFNTGTFFNTDTILSSYLNTYSLSKKHFLDWGKQFAETKKIKFINLKLEHMFGGNDDDSKFVTYLIKNLLKNVKELNLTKGEQKRDFIYIEDVVSAYSLLVSKLSGETAFYHEYQLGSGEAVAIKDFVKLIHQLTQSTTEINYGALPYRENEIMFSQANIDPLKAKGWQPHYNLIEGLQKTIQIELESLKSKS